METIYERVKNFNSFKTFLSNAPLFSIVSNLAHLRSFDVLQENCARTSMGF